MSAHALGPWPVDFLPPGLQPGAIAQAAPGTERRLSLLVACLLYSSLAATLVLAAEHQGLRALTQRPTQTILLVEARDRPPEPPLTAMQDSGPRFRPPMAKALDERPLPVAQSTVVPDKSGDSPSKDLSSLGDSPSDPRDRLAVRTFPLLTRPPTTDSTVTGAGRSVVLELEPSAVRVLHQVQPNYPQLARQAKVQGSVVLQMTIDAQGFPTEVRVVSSTHPAFEGESLRVARLWRFEPARLEGRPMAAKFNLTLHFSLK